MAGAKMTAEQILEDQGVSFPWPVWKNNLNGQAIEGVKQVAWSWSIFVLILAILVVLMSQIIV